MPERTVIEYTLKAGVYMAQWGKQKVAGPDPLELDKALDKAGAPRPRILVPSKKK